MGDSRESIIHDLKSGEELLNLWETVEKASSDDLKSGEELLYCGRQKESSII